MARQLYLSIFDNEKAKFVISSDKKMVIGRSPDYDIDLSQYFSTGLDSISRQHLEIFLKLTIL